MFKQKIILKLLILPVFFLTLIFFLVGCVETQDSNNQDDNNDNQNSGSTMQAINFYYINDLHGALLEGDGEMGMARIGNFLLDEKANNPKRTVILGGGDMVQGTLSSNYFYGENTTRIMDEVGFDATVVGNHEFDWGLEMVTRYYEDGHDDVYRAQHGFLAANIFYDGTEEIPSGIEPYMMLEKDGLNIGIIGAMGYGLESSILASMVEGYYFADPVPIIEEYSQYLREEKAADIVVVISHDSGTTNNNMNFRIAQFDESSRIDAVFNGHSHRVDTDKINGMPTIISGSSGSHVGHVQIQFQHGEVVNSTARNLSPSDDARFNTPHSDIESLIAFYQEEIDHLYFSELTTAGFQSRSALTHWMSRLMLKATDADFAFQNSGGTRDDFYDGEAISIARLYDVFPFDNTVVTVEVDGHEVMNLIDGNSGYASTIHANDIDLNATYKIATNNYVFYHPRNNTQYGENIIYKPFEMFDLAVEAYHRMVESGETFSTEYPLDITYYESWMEATTD